MHKDKHQFIGVYLLISIIIILFTEILIFPNWWWQFYILVFGLLFFVIYEMSILYKSNDYRYFVNPIVISSITTFLFSLGGLTSLLLTYKGKFFIQGSTYMVDLLYKEPKWMVKGIGYSFIAAICTWLGYKMNLGSKLYKQYSSFYSNLLVNKINKSRLTLFLIFAIGVKVYLFSKGLYGYQQIGTGEFIHSRLHVFQSLGSLLFALSIYLKEKYPKSSFFKYYFYISFCSEFVFSILHGARSSVILFFAIFVVTNLIIGYKFRFRNIIVLGTVVYLAFTLGAQFKQFYGNTKDRGIVTNPIKSIDAFLSNRNEIKEQLNTLNEVAKKDSGIDNIAFYFAVSRFCYLGETALSIYHKDKIGLTQDDPSFIYYLATSPFFAIFPSYFLFGIKEPEWGGWFLLTVQKESFGGWSVAFSPLGYLYFAGGILAVCIGFFIYGIILKFAYNFILKLTLVKFIIFFALFSAVFTFDTAVHGMIIGVIRYVLLLPIAYLLLFTSPLKLNTIIQIIKNKRI